MGNVILPLRGANGAGGGTGSSLNVKDLPEDSWLAIELYIDYNNDKVYFSVPSLNHTVALDTKFPLYLSGGGDHDDNPVKLELYGGYGSTNHNPVGTKIDNINISAQNFTPTVHINEFVSDKFNQYPNPATSVVTISNSENIGIKELLIYDITGRQISTYSYKNEYEVQLNIKNLNSGTYFLHIVTNEGTGVKKLIKK